MREPRTVACPACGAHRDTKANPGVALVCRDCGHKFLTPPLDEPAPAAPPAPDPGPGAVKVSRGTPKIPQNARPRPRGADAEQPPPAAPPPPAPEPAPPVPASTGGRDGKTGDIDTLTKAGRRGGLARYARSKTRG